MKKILIFIFSLIFVISLSSCDRLRTDRYEGRYDLTYFLFSMDLDTENFSEYYGIEDQKTKVIKNQNELDGFEALITEELKAPYSCSSDRFNETIDFSNKNICITAFYNSHAVCGYDVTSIVIENSIIKQSVEITVNIPATGSSSLAFVYLIVDKNSITDDIHQTIETNAYKIRNYNQYVCYKPVIYFYPECDMKLNVKYVNSERLINTYPQIDDDTWYLNLNSNNTFTTINSSREYYAIYFDEYIMYNVSFNEGFKVNSEDAINFLEEKLDYIGLTNREANEFIMYWLPVLNEYETSLVYFELTDERNNECPLEFSSEPDTLIRVIVHIKKAELNDSITEQVLPHYERSGFTVVEWGGVNY